MCVQFQPVQDSGLELTEDEVDTYTSYVHPSPPLSYDGAVATLQHSKAGTAPGTSCWRNEHMKATLRAAARYSTLEPPLERPVRVVEFLQAHGAGHGQRPLKV